MIENFENHESQNIDECANNGHKCSIIATCIDRDGGYTCQCPEGFRNGLKLKILCHNKIKDADIVN